MTGVAGAKYCAMCSQQAAFCTCAVSDVAVRIQKTSAVGCTEYGAGHWSAAYVGLPYAQADCGALAELVQREVFGRELHLPRERAAGLRGLTQQIRSLVDDFGEKIDEPYDGCGMLMISRGRLEHVGLYCVIDGVPHVLHAMRNAGATCLHRLVDLPSIGLRVEGFYRWK